MFIQLLLEADRVGGHRNPEILKILVRNFEQNLVEFEQI
jgi:hypothetical protein